ncbi:MAG TPA: hypothetical protein VJ959_08310 [Desulfotignum sp.]|nr:hypothetical protein [Desulfotignum sp.]
MQTEHGTIKKTETGLEVIYENGKTMLVVENLKTNNVPAHELNAAWGIGRKPRGKKIYRFIVKNNGEVLAVI